MKKSIRILSILMAFVMLIGNFSVMGSAYHAYKGTAIAGSYNDVDSPEFTLDQYASMALDELDRMLAKEQMVLDLLGLLTLDLTSVDATIASVLSFLDTGAALIPLLGDAKTLPNICEPLEGVSRGAKTDSKKDIEIIYALLDFVANLRDIAHNYVAGTVSVGILDGFIADYKFNVRELAIGLIFGMLEEGKAIDFDYMDDGAAAIPAKYLDNNNGAITLLQTLLNELVLGEWKLLDDEFNNPQSNVDYFNYGFTEKYGETYFDTDKYNYYGYVHPQSWVTVGLGGCVREDASDTTVPAAIYDTININTTKKGYDFIENLMRTAYNHLLVPVLNRDTIEWVLGLCGYTFDEKYNNKTLWRPLTNEDGTPMVDENGEPVYGSVANLDYDPDYHGEAPAELPVIAQLFKHEEMHAGNIKVQTVTVPDNMTFVEHFNTVLGDFVANIATNNYPIPGTDDVATWTWDYSQGNAALFDNIVDFGKYVVIVTGDLFFSDRAELPSAADIKAMSGQEIVSLILREILNNSVDYIYVEDTYNTLVDVGYRATEQLAYQDIPHMTYTKPVLSDFDTPEEYYAAVVDKMIDILFDIAVYNLNQGFDMDPNANGTNPLTNTGLLQYQGDNGSYETNLVKIAEWGIGNYGALLNTKYVDFRCDNPGTHTADDVWMDLDTLINAIIPIKGGEGATPWISEVIAGDGTQIVSKNFIFNHLLKPLYTLDATNLVVIFDKNESGAFATMNGVQIIVDILDNVFDLIFPDVFQPQATVDAVLQNELLADMVYDLIGSLGYSSFTNAGGATMEGRGGYIAATALPLACMLLGLADDQEFEEMEIYLPETIAAGSTSVSFEVINGSSGINTGYTDENGNFTQDQLYTYKIVSKNVYTYNSAGVNTNAVADNLARGATIAGGDRVNVTLTGTFAENTLIEYVVNYDVNGESGDAIASGLSKTVYAYVGKTDKSDDEREEFVDLGSERELYYAPAIFLEGGDDLDDIESYVIRVEDTDKGSTGALNATAVSGLNDYVQLSTEPGDISHNMTGEGGVYFVYPFEVKTHTVTDEESNETYEEKWNRKEPIYAVDEETGEVILDENGDPVIEDYTVGIEDGAYTLTTVVNAAGTEKNINTALFLYDDYGLEGAFDRAVTSNRQLSNYYSEDGSHNEAYSNYVAVLKDVARFVLKPKAASSFWADIQATNNQYKNRYEELAEALELAIEALEVYEKNSGITGITDVIKVYSGLNYSIVAGPDADYRKDLEYDDPAYVYFGMRDYVPHTYNRYKDALRRANSLVESQEIVAMAPFTDADIYGENYQPSEEDLIRYGESIAAYQEAKANQGVVGSIEAIYAIHMLNLTGERLIRIEADTSKLQLIYNEFAGKLPESEAANYTRGSVEQYRRAEAFALRTLNTPITGATGEPDLAPSQVNKATSELVYAWKHLTKGADYSVLNSAINASAEAIAAGDPETQTVYSPETYDVFYAAYQAAVNLDKDLGDTTDNNNLIAKLAEELNAARDALEFASSGEPYFELSTDPLFFDLEWGTTVVPTLDYDGPASWGLALEDGTPVDAYLFAGIGLSDASEIEPAFATLENCEVIITEDSETYMHGTGTSVQVVDLDGNVLETYYVIVKGEINNDMSIDVADADEIKSFAAGGYNEHWYESPRIGAGDINNDYSVDTGDADLIKAFAKANIPYDMLTGEQIIY